jgi:ubiquinone biosynthesis protein COQ9
VTETAHDLEALRDTLLLAALPHVAFDGWSMKALTEGAEEAGRSAADLLHAFPDGVAGAVAHFSDWADRKAVAAIQAADLRHLKTHQRIAMGVWTRLEAMGHWREAARRATLWLATPRRAALSSKLLYRTCDRLWRAAGDISTDFNFYTKRGLLSGVVISTTLYWLQDSSEGSQASSAFLDRRIAEVLKVGGRIGRLRGALDNFDPSAILARLRRSA